MVSQWGGDPTDKSVFLRGIREIRDETFTQKIIKGTFRKRGIYPFNPDLIVKPPTEREEQEFVPLEGFDQPFGDDTRGIVLEALQDSRELSPVPSSSSIEQPETPRSIKKSFSKLLKAINSPLDEAQKVEKVERRFTRIETTTITKFEEWIIKNSMISKVNKVRSEYTNSNRSKRQITKVKDLTTRGANARITTRTEKENEQWVRRVRRENAKKLAEQEKLERLREKARNGSDIERLFEPFGLFYVDTEGDSSLRV